MSMDKLNFNGFFKFKIKNLKDAFSFSQSAFIEENYKA